MISFTTMGQDSMGAAPWNVDFSTRVPRGSVSAIPSARPDGEPVASTTNGNLVLFSILLRSVRVAADEDGLDSVAARERELFGVFAEHHDRSAG